MSLGSGRGGRHRLLRDPVSIRALAHPIRLDLRALVGRHGLITAADAARELGISHGLASHHLHQLAKYGFVEQVPGADNRQRPWRLVDTSTPWERGDTSPETAAEVAVLEQVLAERALGIFLDWQERRSAWSEGWRQHSGLGTSTVYLTETELIEVSAAIEAVIGRYVEQRPLDDVAARPTGSLPVDFTLLIVPNASMSSGE